MRFFLFVIIFTGLIKVYSQEADIDTVFNLGREILVFSNTCLLAPNKIQGFNSEFIKKTNAGQLSDILKMADGVYVKDYGFNSGLKTISVNSTQSEQVLLIYNGMRLNSRQNSYFDTGLLRIDAISDITISSGGSSALYGSDAIGGVINIVSDENNNDNKHNFEIKSAMGSYGLKNVYGKIRITPLRNFKFSASYFFESSNNRYRYHYFNGISLDEKERENSDYYNHSVNLNSEYKIERNKNLSWFLIYSYWMKGLPGIETGYNSSTARQTDRDLITSANYSSKISTNLNYSGNIGYRYSLMNYYDPATFGFAIPVNSFYKLQMLSHTGIVSYNFNPKTETKIIYEAGYNDFVSNETERGKSLLAGVSVNLKRDFNIKPLNNVTIFPSVRYDYYSNINNPNIVTAKLGINLRPVNNINFALKGSVGNNFRAPSFNDMYWNSLGNKNLLPEKSISIDGGFIYAFKLYGNFETEASYFHIRTTDRILWSPGEFNIWRPENIGEVVSQGIDLSAKLILKLKKYWDFQSGVNYNISEAIKTSKDYDGDPTYNKQLIYIPKQQFKANLVINYLPTSKILKSLSLMLFYNYAGKRYSNLENTVFTPYYEVLDGNILFVFKQYKLEAGVKFSVNNILNKDYQIVSGYPMPLRNFKAELSIKY